MKYIFTITFLKPWEVYLPPNLLFLYFNNTTFPHKSTRKDIVRKLVIEVKCKNNAKILIKNLIMVPNEYFFLLREKIIIIA